MNFVINEIELLKFQGSY